MLGYPQVLAYVSELSESRETASERRIQLN